MCSNVVLDSEYPELYRKMLSRRDPSQVEGLMKFFKTGPGQVGPTPDHSANPQKKAASRLPFFCGAPSVWGF